MDEGQDKAAQAFEDLRGEVTLARDDVAVVRRTVQELPEPIDYTETLGQLQKSVNTTAERTDQVSKALTKMPTLAMTPEQMAQRIETAAHAARQEDRQALGSARQGMEEATRQLHSYIVSARKSDEQTRLLYGFAAGGIILGAMLWVLLAGPIARSLPTGWLMPERMAASALGMPIWEGGQRMMQAASPGGFASIIAGDRIVTANREALEACQKRANKARKAVRCTISVEAERKTP